MLYYLFKNSNLKDEMNNISDMYLHFDSTINPFTLTIHIHTHAHMYIFIYLIVLFRLGFFVSY